jgi:hypothetical protein
MEEAAANIIVNIGMESSDEDSEDALDGGSAADSASGEVGNYRTLLSVWDRPAE